MIVVNNIEFSYREGMTLQEAVDAAMRLPEIRALLNKGSHLYILNDTLVNKRDADKTLLSDSDSIKIMRMAQGG